MDSNFCSLKLQRLVLGEDGEVETQYFRVGDTIEFDVIEKVAYGTERNVYRASPHEKIRFFLAMTTCWVSHLMACSDDRGTDTISQKQQGDIPP